MSEKTVKITFIMEKDREERVIDVPLGKYKHLLEVAHAYNIPLEGACEGSLACSTCHGYIDRKYCSKLDDPKEEEEDMLDLAWGLKPNSRLCCQIKVTESIDSITITVPSETRNVKVNNE